MSIYFTLFWEFFKAGLFAIGGGMATLPFLSSMAERFPWLTQEQLAARMQLIGCDMTRSALAKIEVGQRMLCPDEIKALRTALSVTYDDILL